MSDPTTVFGRPLQRNPAIAISVPHKSNTVPMGPSHRVQFVIEFVGPRSIPAASAVQLLTPQWHDALGKPEAYAMAPADERWSTLNPNTAGSYDSLAIAWNLISPRGRLSNSSASQLFRIAESFASQIQRRAMPLPPPGDVDRTVANLEEIKEGLDIGVEVLIVPIAQEFLERDVWIALAELGYDLAESGFFELKSVDGKTLLSVIPTGGQNAFTLGQVQQGTRHPGLVIGFNVPTSPDPEFALAGLFQTANHLCAALHGVALTDDDHALDTSREQLRTFLRDGIAALRRVGIAPGSNDALRLFA